MGWIIAAIVTVVVLLVSVVVVFVVGMNDLLRNTCYWGGERYHRKD